MDTINDSPDLITEIPPKLDRLRGIARTMIELDNKLPLCPDAIAQFALAQERINTHAE